MWKKKGVVKIQVLIVGFNRSLSVTYPSIKRRILNPLRRAGDVHPTFVLSRTRQKVSSAWTGEEGLAEWNPPQAVLSLPHFFVEQEDIDAKLTPYFETVANWSAGRASVDKTNAINLLRQLWLLDFAQQFIDPEADFLLYLRPDLLMRNRFPMKALRLLRDGPESAGPEILTPNWGFQPNDRLALMRPESAPSYFGRIRVVESFLETKDKALVGEWLLSYAFEKGTLRPALALRGQRVRSNYSLAREQFGQMVHFDVPKRRHKITKAWRRFRENPMHLMRNLQSSRGQGDPLNTEHPGSPDARDPIIENAQSRRVLFSGGGGRQKPIPDASRAPGRKTLF